MTTEINAKEALKITANIGDKLEERGIKSREWIHFADYSLLAYEHSHVQVFYDGEHAGRILVLLAYENQNIVHWLGWNDEAIAIRLLAVFAGPEVYRLAQQAALENLLGNLFIAKNQSPEP